MRFKQKRIQACKQEIDALMDKLSEKFKAVKASEDDRAMVDFESDLETALEEAAAIALRVKASIQENDDTAAMRAAISEAQVRLRRRYYAMKAIDRLHVGSPLDSWEERDDRLRAIRDLADSYSDIVEEKGLDLNELKTELEVALHRWFDPLWASVKTNRDAFEELFVFVTGASGYSTNNARPYIDSGIGLDLSCWNDAVAIHKKDPVYADFIGLNPDLKPSEVLRMAAEAKVDNDPTAIKIVLAYCKYTKHAGAVGWLRQELAVMVVVNERAAQR